MENAKKMLLVDPNLIEKLKQKETSCEDSLSRLDKEMHKIINSNLEDREKWAMYLQTLQRYLHFSEEKNNPFKIHIVNDDEHVQPNNFTQMQSNKRDNQNNSIPVANEKSPDSHIFNAYSSDHLLKLIPKTFKKKAEFLINTISQNPEKIKWNEKGIVCINEKEIPNSNILDLINITLRQLKRPKPVALEEFTKTLIDLGVPSYCIGNPETQKYLQKLHTTNLNDSTPKARSGSPRPTRRKKIDWARWTPY